MTEQAAPMLGNYRTYRNANDGTEIEAYYAAPRNAKSPAVIIMRGVAGPDSGYVEIADALVRAGYAALAHRWQVRGDDPIDASLISDVQAAVTFLQSRPEVDGTRIAIFGYCKGGGQALIAAAVIPQIRAVVAFHGFARRPNGPDPQHQDPIGIIENLKRPVLLLHGEDDQLSRLESMRDLSAALTAADCPGGIHIYIGADHGFAVSTHKGYRPADASDSFSRGVAFLKAYMP